MEFDCIQLPYLARLNRCDSEAYASFVVIFGVLAPDQLGRDLSSERHGWPILEICSSMARVLKWPIFNFQDIWDLL